MFKRLVTTALVFGMAALAPPAAAQSICGARLAITGALTATFGETMHAVGLSGPRQVIEVWVAEETQGWTILVTRSDNISCVVARGTHLTLLHSEGDLAADLPRD